MIVEEKIKDLEAELLAVLEEEREILSELARITVDEQKALVSARVEDLDGILKGKEAITQRLHQAETRRSKAAAMMADSLGLESESSLRDISARLDGPASKRLLDLGLEVAEIGGQADSLNRVNAYLIGTSLNYLETFMNRLAGWRDPNHTYMPGGSFKTKKKSNLFINQEA